MGYTPAGGRATGCRDGMARLGAYIESKLAPHGNYGCFNPGSVLSSGTPSLHADGRAIDFAFNANDPTQREEGDRLFYWAIDHHEPIGLQEILYRGNLWSDQNQDLGVRFPFQQGPHMNHVHLGVDRPTADTWTVARLGADAEAPASSPPTIEPEEDMIYVVQDTQKAWYWWVPARHQWGGPISDAAAYVLAVSGAKSVGYNAKAKRVTLDLFGKDDNGIMGTRVAFAHA